MKKGGGKQKDVLSTPLCVVIVFLVIDNIRNGRIESIVEGVVCAKV